MTLPLFPFFYSDRRMTSSSQLVKRAIIPTRVERDLYLTQVPDIESYYFEKEKARKSRIKFAPMNYLEQLFIEKREWATKYPQDSDLSIVYLDIEVLTRGEKRFPRAKTNPIISIGAALNEESPIFFGEYNSEVRDAVLLIRFLDWFKSVDPDLVITYNGEGFDIPYIVERAKLNGINATSFLNRINGDPLTGRVHFDLYHSAESDQSLFGIKSKSLKDVAEWFGHSVQRLGDPNNTEALIGSEELRNYQLSDVQLTRGVSKAYLPNAVALANLLKVPLGSVVNCWPSFIPKLLIARGCHLQGLVAIDNNLERYGDKDRKGSLFNLGTTKYEGAIVDCLKFGYIPGISKVDFSSMYPSAIRTWNLGPDTTKIVSLKPFSGSYSTSYDGTKMILDLPDSNLNRQIVVEVETATNGVLKHEIESLSEERKRIKSALDSEWDDNLNSRQIAIKVILNSIYGYTGSPYASYGDTGTGLAITSLCRWTSKQVSKRLSSVLVNIDTDGFIVDSPVEVDNLNKEIESEIRNHFNRPSYMTLEQEALIDGYFHKMKNYIVRKTKKGKIVVEKHGVKFKSSRQCKVADKLLDALTSKVFDSGSGMKNFSDDYQYEWAQEWLDLSRFDLDDFKFRLRFSKTLDQYADSLSLPRQLAIQAEDILGIDITDGLQLEYFVTNKPVKCDRYVGALVNANRWRKPYYTIAEEVKSIDELDLDYIRDQMVKYFEVFDWTYSQQRSLF